MTPRLVIGGLLLGLLGGCELLVDTDAPPLDAAGAGTGLAGTSGVSGTAGTGGTATAGSAGVGGAGSAGAAGSSNPLAGLTPGLEVLAQTQGDVS